jgi:serine/threonine-protein phosphatase 4 regulatory subunit 4
MFGGNKQLCAYNFPAILKAIGTRKYFIMLHHTYVQLAQDIAPAVRSTIAASFHEVILKS